MTLSDHHIVLSGSKVKYKFLILNVQHSTVNQLAHHETAVFRQRQRLHGGALRIRTGSQAGSRGITER